MLYHFSPRAMGLLITRLLPQVTTRQLSGLFCSSGSMQICLRNKGKKNSWCCFKFQLNEFFFLLCFPSCRFLERRLISGDVPLWKSSILSFECHTSGYLLCLFCICSVIICVFSEESHMCSLFCNSITHSCVCTSNGIHWQNRSSPIQSRRSVNVDLHYSIGAIKVKSFPLNPSGLILIMTPLSALACADHLTRLVIMPCVTFSTYYSPECVKVQRRYQEMDFEGKLRTGTLQICLRGPGLPRKSSCTVFSECFYL